MNQLTMNVNGLEMEWKENGRDLRKCFACRKQTKGRAKWGSGRSQAFCVACAMAETFKPVRKQIEEAFAVVAGKRTT
jgi:REP element-mobilizing transposase RayT